MSRPPTPFAWVGGVPHLIVNYDLEPDEGTPSQRTCLDHLLQHHDPHTILLLRRLTCAERRVLELSSARAEVEAWARMVVINDDRYRGRTRIK